jgi:nucleotide-binding universal stress UspA family protein
LWLLSAVPAATTEHVAKLRERGENVSESGYLRSVAQRLEGSPNVRWEIIHDDDPVEAIARFVETHDVRLVVATTHGETGLARRAFGSVSIGMVERLPVPVLVVKSGGTDSVPLST